jgi:RNA polymerase-binding transcription factor DksA
MKAPPAHLGAADRNRVLSLQAALDLLNEVQVDLRIVAHIHQAKNHVEDAIARITNEGECLDCGKPPLDCACD